jgi:hypothetical protein
LPDTSHIVPDTAGHEFRYEKCPTFSGQFRWHLRNGTRPNGNARQRGKRWTQVEFAGQMLRGADDPAARGRTARSVSHWLDGTHPSEDSIGRILTTLFGRAPGKDSDFEQWREHLHRLWLDAADAPRSIPAAPGKVPPSDEEPKHNPPAGPSPATHPPARTVLTEWMPEEPWTLREGLGRLYVHQSPNEPPAAVVALAVTAEAGRVYLTIEKTEDTPRVTTTFAVVKAEIVVVKDLNVWPVKGTTLGADIPHPNVSFASSWHLRCRLPKTGSRAAASWMAKRCASTLRGTASPGAFASSCVAAIST